MTVQPIPPQPGQESVWDYPRPPRLEASHKHVRVMFHGIILAETRRAYRVLETSHPPVYYIPPSDIQMQYLLPSSAASFCEWKGGASYYSVCVGGETATDAAWYYPHPTLAFAAVQDYVAFYPSRMSGCFVDEERVQSQAGDFYGGWITHDIVGPFKGEPGTRGW